MSEYSDLINAMASTSAAISSAGQAMANTKKYKDWRRSFDHSHKANIEDWNMVNEYNLPVNQVNRLLQAGINPNSMQISGSAGSINSSQGQAFDYANPLQPLENLPNMVMQSKIADAQVKKTEAETQGQEINNRITDALGMSTAKANLDNLEAELKHWQLTNQAGEIYNSKLGHILEAQLTESLERGESVRLDNLIRTEAFQDIVDSYGWDNAMKYSQILLMDKQREYIPKNYELGQRMASAAEMTAYSNYLDAKTNQMLAPSQIDLNSANARKAYADSLNSSLDALVKTGNPYMKGSPAQKLFDEQVNYWKQQALRLPAMTANEANKMALDFYQWLNTPVPTNSYSVSAYGFSSSGTDYKSPQDYMNNKRPKNDRKTGQFD